MKKPIHIFVGYTAFHAKFTEKIIEELDGEVICIFTKRWPRTQKDYIKVCDINRRNKLTTLFTYVFSLIRFRLFVRKLSCSNNDIRIYVPHPLGIFSNVLFFSSYVNKISIYEDGLSNYIDRNSDVWKFSKFTNMLSRTLFLRLNTYSGHLAGWDTGKVDAVYLSMPDKSVLTSHPIQLITREFSKQSVVSKPNTILFLDQRTSDYISKDKRRELLDCMYRIFPKDNYTYIYKPHHDYISNDLDMQVLDNELSSMTAEDLISLVKPEIVIGFFSSALYNISNIYDSIKIYSLAGNQINISRFNKRISLQELFDDLGVMGINCN